MNVSGFAVLALGSWRRAFMIVPGRSNRSCPWGRSIFNILSSKRSHGGIVPKAPAVPTVPVAQTVRSPEGGDGSP
jgi:hypothetical protein